MIVENDDELATLESLIRRANDARLAGCQPTKRA
jgi:hypothetical protein